MTRHRPVAVPKVRTLAWMPVAILVACQADEPDAYGTFESTEVTVSAEVTGVLTRFAPEEGSRLRVGDGVAQVDTTAASLELREVEVRARLATTRIEEARSRLRALQAQLEVARDDRDRALRLAGAGAATAAEVNRLESTVTSLEEEVAAARARVRLAGQEVEALEARQAQIQDRIRRAAVINPVQGVVLTTYVEAGEFVSPGRPLYTVAPLDTLVLRAYVTGAQLPRLRVGSSVIVQHDAADGGFERREGRVTWISPEAEFTPTPIQTREERVDQVYAVKVRVPNTDGRLKIGMPGELVLAPGGGSEG